MSIFTTSKRNEVYIKVNKFDEENTHAFCHAAFDQVTINGHTCTMPRSYSGAQGGVQSILHINTVNTIEDFENKGDRGMFYIELNPIVISEGQLGDYKGQFDNWTGCFQLGLI
jgi:hypothetical protein